MFRHKKYCKEDIESLQNKKIIVFDTETTGLSKSTHEIIQLSALKFQMGEKVEKIDELNLYIRPIGEVSDKITEITGITSDFLKDKPCEKELFSQIYDFFKDVECIAAYNIKFDYGFMEELYKRNGSIFEKKGFDVLEMARDLVPAEDVDNYKLATIASVYGLDDRKFHDSMEDTAVTSELLFIFCNEYKEIAEEKGGIVPNVESISYYLGFRGNSRVYVNTDCGTFYYDIKKHVWDRKPDNPYMLSEIDMNALTNRVREIAQVKEDVELSKFRGAKKVR